MKLATSYAHKIKELLRNATENYLIYFLLI